MTTLRSKLHPGQYEVTQTAARYNVLACGRRWGKTELGKHVAVAIAAGKAQPVGWFSPTYRMLAEVWRNLVNTLQPITARAIVSEHRIELVTGGTIEMWSLDAPDSARGRRYARVILDEAAMVSDLEGAWSNVIRPALTDYKGDAWFLSTPRGHNYFWRLWQAGQDPEQTDWRSWQMPTSSNPFIDPTEIESARQMLPEQVFAQEYLAQFMADGGQVFRRITDAVRTFADPADSAGTCVMGLDWGKLNDFTVLSVFDLASRQQIALDRFNRIDYQFQLERLLAMVDRYKPVVVLAESNSMGEPLIEQLRRAGVRVQAWNTTSSTKAVLIEDLALAFERGEIGILPDPVQMGELLAYTSERLPSGVMRYGAPAGMHDDTVMALALAWQAAKRQLPAAVHGIDPFADVSGRNATTGAVTLKPGEFGGLRFGIERTRRPTLEF